jgi:hypothetical protein
MVYRIDEPARTVHVVRIDHPAPTYIEHVDPARTRL